MYHILDPKSMLIIILFMSDKYQRTQQKSRTEKFEFWSIQSYIPICTFINWEYNWASIRHL